MRFLRLLAAGLFVYVGLMGAALFLSPWFDPTPPWWVIGLLFGIIAVLVMAAIALFGERLRPGVTLEEAVRDLEEKGLLVEETFEAHRAFQIEELEDEGSHYMIELIDGRVLYLTGQYLYDYEPISDDPDFAQPRQFPCTRFTVRRHRDEGFVADLICEGESLQPETIAPSFTLDEYESGEVPEDGEILETPYEDIKRHRQHAQRA